MTCNIEPLGHRLVILPDKVETKSKGGIIVSTPTREGYEQKAMQNGTVVAIGDLAFKEHGKHYAADGSIIWGKPWVEVGDHVSYVKWAGAFTKDEISAIEYIILNDEDIKCRFKSKPEEAGELKV